MSPRTRKHGSKAEPSAKPKTKHAAWQGPISFGLIHIPVFLYRAASDRRVAFHQLHKSDGVRIKQKRVCPADGEEVPYADIVKGYEIEPGRYVVVEPEELDAIAPERSRAVELEKFVDIAEVDPLYYEDSYFVLPGEGAELPYALLREAMVAEKRAAVARLVIHQKEHLVVLWPRDDMLVLSTLHFADEVADPRQLDGDTPATARNRAELKAARQLISALSASFDINEYRDDYRERVLELIEAKAKGRRIAVQPEVEERAPTADLMAALEKSLATLPGHRGGGNGKRKRARTRGDPGTHRAR